MLRIAVFVSGGGTNLQALLHALEDGRITDASIPLVISSNKDAHALVRARQYGIAAETISPKECISREDFSRQLLDCLKQYEIDLIILAGYLVILPESLVKEYRNKIINVHPSLIPAFCGDGYYGLKVHEAVLKRGNKVTGATVHFVDEGTDTGPILLQKAVDVREDDTPSTLSKRVMEEAEWIILPRAVQLIAQNQVRVVGNTVKRRV